jgi:hypothetical protein
MANVEEYRVEPAEIGGIEVILTTYRIDPLYHCHIANVSVGAVIARASAASREEAVELAKKRLRGRVESV